MSAEQKRIKRWIRPLAEMPTWQAIDWLHDSKPRAVRSAVAAMEICTRTNCWWGDYRTATALLPVARAVLRLNTEVNARGEAASQGGTK